MWRFRLRALYCVRMEMRRRFELMQFESVMSMMRYRAPKGTAGLARSRVSGHRRSPWPPARSTTMASRISDIGCPRGADERGAHSNNRSREKDKRGGFEAGDGGTAREKRAGKRAWAAQFHRKAA